MEPASSQPERAQPGTALRYHALDSLRAGLMLLGLALHSATSYTTRSLGDAWPYNDGNGSRLFDCLVLYTHLFRMPLFFVLSGFFGALVMERRGTGELARNRVLRIGMPLLVGWLLTFPFVKSGFVHAVNAGKPDGWQQALASLRTPFAASVSPRFPLTWIHLWFLYYLVLFFAGALLVSRVAVWLPQTTRRAGTERFQRVFRRALLSPFRVVWFAIPTFALLSLMPVGILETDPYLNPAPPILAVYALFFGFGWCLYHNRDLLDVGAKQARFAMVLTVPVFLLLLVTALKISPELTIDLPNRVVLAACGAFIVWLLTFALIGLESCHASHPSRLGRYLADASYWLYLTHLPIVVWLVALLARVSLPCGLKFLLVLTGTAIATLVSYDLLVRNTMIGVFLNGRRYPRGLPVLESPQTPSVASPVPTREKESAQAVVSIADDHLLEPAANLAGTEKETRR